MISPSYITGEMSPDFEEALRLGAQAGVKIVQLRMGLYGKNVENVEDADLPRIKDALDRFGIQVGTLLPPFAKCSIEDAATIRAHHTLLIRTVQLARKLGARNVRIFPFQRPGAEPFEPSRLDGYLDRVVHNLLPAVRVAESEGVTLCLEGISNTLAHTAMDTRRVIDALGSPAVAAIWELDSGCRSGELPSQGYPHLRGLIRDVHVKANAAGELDPVSDSPETADAFLRPLLEDGYDGPVTIEHWKGAEGTLKGLRQLQAALDRVESTTPHPR